MSIYDLNFNYYFKIYKTVHEMMYDRGYKPMVKRLTREEYVSKLKDLVTGASAPEPFEFIDSLSLIFKKETKCLVYFHILDAKFRKVDLEYIHQFMSKKNAKSLVLITKDIVSSRITNLLSILQGSAQVFCENELVVNTVKKHQLIPDYSRLNPEEKQKFLDAYRIGVNDLHKLPGLFTSDPVCKYYNFQVNDIIKISDSDDGISSCDNLYYRIVRNG